MPMKEEAHSDTSGQKVTNKPCPKSVPELDALFQERIDLLRSIIEEIIREIKSRKVLRNGALREIEEELNQLSSSLNEVAPMGYVNVTGRYEDNINWRRIHLEKSIARLRELRRTHKISTWKDIVSLKQELFRLLPEYARLLQLKNMINRTRK